MGVLRCVRTELTQAFLFCGALAIGSPLAAQRTTPLPTKSIVTQSPDGQLVIVVGRSETGGAASQASYSVRWRGKPIVGESALGLDFVGSAPFGAGVSTALVARSSHDEIVRGLIGKASTARDHYREAVIALTETLLPHRRIDLVVRAYDDGVAFRYRIPAQSALTAFTIAAERTHVVVDGASQAYALQRSAFVSSYEGFYTVAPLREFSPDSLLALPVVLHHPGGAWLAISEAALSGYAGMYLARLPGASGDLVSRLSPLPDNPGAAVRGRTPFETPWRVLMVSRDPAQLIASNLITVLNPPSALADASWIHPGKTTFPWWNDYVVPNAGFTPGLNTATARYYIDFCAAHGIPYHTLDGYLDMAWYGGHIDPGELIPDITRGTDTLDLPGVLRYAKQKGVRIRVWMHWKALRPQLDSALARYERMGIEGIMVDFMDRDDQEMLALYHEIIAKAAAHHLTVVLHGTSKPTGMSRTYPNLLTVEAVMGLEYDKFTDKKGITPQHELLVPFTRMLAGPLDFHQGGFRYVTEAEFHPTYTSPAVIGTRARTLAMYVVYEDPLPMMADAPSAYVGQPGLDFLAAIPTTWDETRAVGGVIGEQVTVARRRGRQWYVGTMTDGHARTVAIPLRFLGPGRFVAEVFSDDETALPRTRHARFDVTAADVIQARLAPAGGHIMRITPSATRTPPDSSPSSSPSLQRHP